MSKCNLVFDRQGETSLPPSRELSLAGSSRQLADGTDGHQFAWAPGLWKLTHVLGPAFLLWADIHPASPSFPCAPSTPPQHTSRTSTLSSPELFGSHPVVYFVLASILSKSSAPLAWTGSLFVAIQKRNSLCQVCEKKNVAAECETWVNSPKLNLIKCSVE